MYQTIMVIIAIYITHLSVWCTTLLNDHPYRYEQRIYTNHA